MARSGSRSLLRDAAPGGTSRPDVIELGANTPVDALVGEWRALAARLPGTSYFQTPDWVLSWWATVGERTPTRVACWRDERGELTALFALSRSRQQLHRRLPISVPLYANAGSGPGDADHCGPLVAPGLWPAVNDWLDEAIGSRSLLVRDATPDLPLEPDARAVETTNCPRLDLAGADAAIGRSPNFRRQLRRYSHRFRRSGVSFEWIPAGGVEPSVVDALFRLHNDRRASVDRATSLTAHHHELLTSTRATAHAGCGPAALVARDGAEVIGVCYGFEWNGTVSAYQSGWDPAYAPQSLGTVLVYEAVVGARAAGLHTFDFLRGTEDYKYRFGAWDQADVTYLVARGLGGSVLRVRSRLRERAGRDASPPPVDTE